MIRFFFHEKQIFFGLVEDELKKESHHYLLLGSEALLSLASNLKAKHNIYFRQRMKEHGSHYIVEATIPVKYVRNTYIEGIYEYLNNGFWESSLVYHKNLPPEFIKAKKVKVPFDRHGFLYM